MLTIQQLRKKVEQIDASIIQKLAEREELVKQIGQLKLAQGEPIIDLSREQELFEFYAQLCAKYQLPEVFINRLFQEIITHSRIVQDTTINRIS